MKPRHFVQLILLVTVILIVFSVAEALAAGLDLPNTNVGDDYAPVTAEELRPAQCSGLVLTNVVTGAGTITGTAGNDLILGSGSADTIDGGGGNDCILAGGGDDTLDGGEGTDVCLGGAGSNTFSNCETAVE
jgi:Ca2+-binding RTX toxin-like protein